MKKISYAEKLNTPLGSIWAAVSKDGLVAVAIDIEQDAFVNRLRKMGFDALEYNPEDVAAVLEQIDEYLAGVRRDFDLPIDWSVMTPFQQAALKATLAIPYGGVSTYGEIAKKLGSASAARAVGRAEATNPMPLVIPCHRVLGSDGELHGYGAGQGLLTKAWLLDLEGARPGVKANAVERQVSLPGLE